SADCAGAVHAGGIGADARRREDVRRGRPRERPFRSRAANRQGREGDLDQQPGAARQAERNARCRLVSFAGLEGKTALVTGASRGIGRAISAELAAAGAAVVLGYRSGRDEAEELAAELGGRAVQADVSSADDAARLVAEAGNLDILV